MNKNIRYYYLNVRSIIENSLRFINGYNSSNTISTQELIDLTKQFIHAKNISNVDFNVIESEYSKACDFVHGNITARMPLAQSFEDCFGEKNKMPKMNIMLQQSIKLIDELFKVMAHSHIQLIDSAFHRRKTILRYLVNDNFLSVIRENK